MHGPSLSPSYFGRFSSRFAVYISRLPPSSLDLLRLSFPLPHDDLLSIILIFLSRLVLATSGKQHRSLYGFVLLTSCRPLVNNIHIASSFHTPHTPLLGVLPTSTAAFPVVSAGTACVGRFDSRLLFTRTPQARLAVTAGRTSFSATAAGTWLGSCLKSTSA